MSERLTKEQRDEIRRAHRRYGNETYIWNSLEIPALLDAADRLDELEAANSETWKERAEKAEARVRELEKTVHASTLDPQDDAGKVG